jgi:SAM-dependent methyltransferase
MHQNLPDHNRILDTGDDPYRPAAGLTGLDVDPEHALEALRPAHGSPACSRRSFSTSSDASRLAPLPRTAFVTRARCLLFGANTPWLHHLPDPARGLQALRSVLRPDGSLFFMLYGKYGRDGVYYLQELFRRLGLTPGSVTPGQLNAMASLIGFLPGTHPMR